MFDIKITDEQKKYAWWLVNEVNCANRGKADGNPEQRYTGQLGEVVMADIINHPRPSPKNGYDNGIDFTIFDKHIDLKTMGRKYPVNWKYWTNNLIKSQVENPKCLTDIYIFSSINKVNSVMTFVGAISKHNILYGAGVRLIPEGTERRNGKYASEFYLKADTYEIDNVLLSEINSAIDITWCVDRMT